MLGDGAGERHEGGDATAASPRKPGVQQRDRPWALELEHQPQFLFEQVGPVQAAVDVGDAGEGAALVDGEVLGVLPQREPGTLELRGSGVRRLSPARRQAPSYSTIGCHGSLKGYTGRAVTPLRSPGIESSWAPSSDRGAARRRTP